MSKTTIRTITQEFEERPLKFEMKTVYCWFTAKAKIVTEIEGDNINDPEFSESRIEWVDISDFEYADTLVEAGEGNYNQPSAMMVKALERDLEVDEFRF
jgi:hypothetical protein